VRGCAGYIVVTRMEADVSARTMPRCAKLRVIVSVWLTALDQIADVQAASGGEASTLVLPGRTSVGPAGAADRRRPGRRGTGLRCRCQRNRLLLRSFRRSPLFPLIGRSLRGSTLRASKGGGKQPGRCTTILRRAASEPRGNAGVVMLGSPLGGSELEYDELLPGARDVKTYVGN
jgi:hypothetical protein